MAVAITTSRWRRLWNRVADLTVTGWQRLVGLLRGKKSGAELKAAEKQRRKAIKEKAGL